MDDAFADYLRGRKTSRARFHGNYLPALDKTVELLAEARTVPAELWRDAVARGLLAEGLVEGL